MKLIKFFYKNYIYSDILKYLLITKHCIMNKLNIFIEKARKIYGNKYDYSKVNYINSLTKVCIICPEHGEFWQTPGNHIAGHGCPKCGTINSHNKQKNTTEEFIKKSKQIHGDKYDYSKVEYINNSTKVCIICPEHGEFWQTPGNHITGQGCPKCGRISMINTIKMSEDEFINASNIKYNSFYNYNKVKYDGCFNKVIITCPIHGDFTQTPACHLHVGGCPKCGRIRANISMKLTTEEFIKKAKEIHGDKYDYSKVEYIDYNTKVCIICPEHGEFWQTPDSHLQGKGCRLCNKSVSKKEKEISDFIESSGLKVINGERNLISPYELDIYIPDKKIGIEYNGILWHSEEYGKNKYYHLNKLSMCKQLGISLIQIFEDEYLNHKDIVLNKIKSLIGINDYIEIKNEENVIIKIIDYKQASLFINNNSLLRFVRSTIYLGAFYNNKLIGVMTFIKCNKKNDGYYELNRVAIDYIYDPVNVYNRLFEFFVKNFHPYNIKTFVDRRWITNEENNVYLKLGFMFDKYTLPNYYYFRQKDGLIRQNKFNFKKDILNKKFGFPVEMSNEDMIKKLGCKKIWDCGYIKYIWRYE